VPGRNVPFPPMEAQLVKELPATNGWQFEPKWDGFRGVLENDGPELALWSRNERPLLRYFPELRPLGDLLPPHSALDGEIVIARDGVLDFDSMQTRLHPAESRIRKLSAEIPAEFIVFDVLLWDGKAIHKQPLEERRAQLERIGEGFRLSPTTADTGVAGRWLDGFEAAGLDGVIAKKLGLPYLPGSRDGVLKVKPFKTADCVIVGVRWKEKPTRIATLLLGLYDDEGKIDYVGSAAVAAGKHDQIFSRVEPLLKDAPDRGFSEPNRWGSGELAESAVRPELVAEVRYDKVQGHRFRHGSRFLRFRDDKDPKDCTWLEVRPPRRAGDPTFESLLGT
jgi:ATP-dependent DNA ligase